MRAWAPLAIASLVVTGCNFVTNNYSLENAGGGSSTGATSGTTGTGGMGGSTATCSVVFRDDFEEPLSVNWVATGEPSATGGRAELGGTSVEKLESKDLFDLTSGGCVTMKIDALELPAGDDRAILFVTDPPLASSITMTGYGWEELHAADPGGGSVLGGLRDPEDALRNHWRICLDDGGLAHFFASVDGITYTEFDDREDRVAAWDVTSTSIAIEAFPSMGSTTTMTVDWLEVCQGFSPDL